MLLVTKVQGPATAAVGESVIFRAIEFNRDNPTADELSTIKWVVQSDGQTIATGNGMTLEFTPTAELAEKAIVAMAYRNSPTPRVSATTFVQSSVEDRLRSGLRALGDEYGQLLAEPSPTASAADLVDRAKALRFDIDDLID